LLRINVENPLKTIICQELNTVRNGLKKTVFAGIKPWMKSGIRREIKKLTGC
jgi:hypothetical protein